MIDLINSDKQDLYCLLFFNQNVTDQPLYVYSLVCVCILILLDMLYEAGIVHYGCNEAMKLCKSTVVTGIIRAARKPFEPQCLG